MLYQIQTKFRDEIRPRAGLMRGREFGMKDAYSFHASTDCLDMLYERVKEAYFKIFERCGLRAVAEEADTGQMGGTGSTEFLINDHEVGHIFKLGSKYAELMGGNYHDTDGKKQVYQMGCYGIGIGRTVAAAIEQFSDDKGLCLPDALAPFECVIIIGNMKDELLVSTGRKIYDKYSEQGIDVLLDDRKERMGVKFKDAELLGIPKMIVVGKLCVDGNVEVTYRTGESSVVAIECV